MRNKSYEPTLRWFITFAAALMIAGFLAGYSAPHSFNSILQPALKKLQEIGVHFHGHPLSTVLLIFVNNSVAAIAMMLLGVFLGVYPLWTMWMNGVILGVVSQLVVQKTHASVFTVLVYAILPHGVFELSALVWASALGFSEGFAGMRAIGGALRRLFMRPSAVQPVVRRQPRGIRDEFARAFHHLPYILGLLLLAACIEGLVTPHLIQMAHL
ncbi:stage II sporulation protein M [Alicyclobacillus sp. SO9]|uniref:stage II sporulation protein M n=1 Tax=Alicyclobacillus sp. SO9 TaxID=2665646 RepID=UPI0018E8E8E6|nr:stage II sporulation protein M [Alicyclobacillus sp. SO9]QQE78494.1 stage II sporulation protein M [Alicyclobacillus sp. SO9]